MVFMPLSWLVLTRSSRDYIAVWIGVVLVVRELLVVRKRFFVLFNFSFFSFSCLWDKVFCCNLFHQGIVVLARWGL